MKGIVDAFWLFGCVQWRLGEQQQFGCLVAGLWGLSPQTESCNYNPPPRPPSLVRLQPAPPVWPTAVLAEHTLRFLNSDLLHVFSSLEKAHPTVEASARDRTRLRASGWPDSADSRCRRKQHQGHSDGT